MPEKNFVKMREQRDRLLMAIDKLMAGNVHTTLQGETGWHERKVPTIEALDFAKATVDEIRGAKP